MDLIDKIKILKNHLNAKNYKKVIEGSSKLLKKAPNNSYLFNITGMAYMGLSQHNNAIKCFMQSLNVDPNNTAAMNNYANSLKAVGKLERSQELYEKVIKLTPNYINVYNNYANLKTVINDYPGAIKLYQKALELLKKNPKAPKLSILSVLFSLAVAYQSDNKIDEAKKVISEIFKIDPNHVGGHKLISSMVKYSQNDNESLNHIQSMESLNKIIEQNDYDRKVDLSFALGKAYEDIKNYSKSFHYYEIANQIKFKKFGSNLEDEKKAMNNIIKIFSDIDLEKSNENNQKKKIIFILGMPRSGTTLMEQIISSHSNVYGAGELIYLQQVLKKNFVYDSKYDKQLIIDQQNMSKNNIISEYFENFNIYNFHEDIITDKAPQNFRFIGFIKLFFPNSKIIHCYRNSKDNCLSLFKNSFASTTMNWTNKPEHIAEFYNIYSKMMNFWKDKIPNFIHDVEYEKLVANKSVEIKKILEFCELDWDEKCLNPDKNSKTPIKTVSINQARQPIYKSSVNNSDNFDVYLNKMYSILD